MPDIKVLGPGFTNCVRLEKLVSEVLDENSQDEILPPMLVMAVSQNGTGSI